MLELGLAAGLSVSGLYGPLKPYRERQLAKIFASGETLRLQFPKEDLGFVYDKPGAAICPVTANPNSRTGRKPEGVMPGTDGTAVGTGAKGCKKRAGSVGDSDRRYKPSCTPGGRMPHCSLHPINSGK